ncbi:hypothetical protein M878_06240 [Streptomyces roseochromogenus subsp. oscitans DS 12.976]|uniref:Uncharacterized protein n=1 Tax=Streptomyces roseochromogenus subsp. oscitans DS 12.976 TaxID=1352936 RepID=V6KTE8_STRRC|nr:hypothetical protein M878_06240 [Streptomyces roseochromogenus subsp. oscitans DS 12.976]
MPTADRRGMAEAVWRTEVSVVIAEPRLSVIAGNPARGVSWHGRINVSSIVESEVGEDLAARRQSSIIEG